MIFDLKKLIQGKNWTTNTKGQNIPWSKIRVLHTDSDNPGILFYKINFDDEYDKLDTNQYVNGNITENLPQLSQAYDDLLKVPALKHKDIMELCTNLSIPIMYHEFYKNLPVNSSSKNQEKEKNDDFSEDSIIEETDQLEQELLVNLKEKKTLKIRKKKNVQKSVEDENIEVPKTAKKSTKKCKVVPKKTSVNSLKSTASKKRSI